MKIDTSRLIPDIKVCSKSLDVENLLMFMTSTTGTVKQILKDKEEYRELCKRAIESEEGV